MGYPKTYTNYDEDDQPWLWELQTSDEPTVCEDCGQDVTLYYVAQGGDVVSVCPPCMLGDA